MASAADIDTTHRPYTGGRYSGQRPCWDTHREFEMWVFVFLNYLCSNREPLADRRKSTATIVSS